MVNTSDNALVNEPDHAIDELPPGTTLSNGTYTITQHLKSGGFGITYLATDTLGRKVVIKECFPSGISTRSSRMVKPRSRIYHPNVESLIERFVVEAHSLAKLSHPNIVKVHQVFKENETAYMALDYVEGHDLLDVMEDSSLSLTPAGVRSTLLKLLDAVGAVHEKGLLHRDISPDNILIDARRNPILIDFGAAREQDRSTTSPASTLHVVKDGYSPQELYLSGGGDQGAWSDLYSLAASFYHVITGEAPANSQARLAALASNTEDPVVPLIGRIPGYDDAFLAAIDKAMSVLPKQRMQSARQWTDAITGGPAAKTAPKTVELSRTVTPMTRVTRFEAEAARKKIGPIAILGGVAVLALVATGVYLAMPGASGAGASGATPAIGKASAAVTAHADPASAEAKAADALAEAATAAATPVVEATAAAPAKPAPVEVAVAEVAVPEPVAAPQVTAVSALSSNWTIDIPFAATADAPTTVATVQGAVPEWLAPGVKILSVNGTPISNLPEIAAIIRETQTPKDATSITATVSIEGPGGAAEETIDLPVVHRVILVSGAEFQARWVDGAWRTEVTQLPDGYNGEVRIGDVIVGHVRSGSRMTGPTDLKTALESEIISGNRSTTLAVQQGGQMWVVTFPLPG